MTMIFKTNPQNLKKNRNRVIGSKERGREKIAFFFGTKKMKQETGNEKIVRKLWWWRWLSTTIMSVCVHVFVILENGNNNILEFFILSFIWLSDRQKRNFPCWWIPKQLLLAYTHKNWIETKNERKEKLWWNSIVWVKFFGDLKTMNSIPSKCTLYLSFSSSS